MRCLSALLLATSALALPAARWVQTRRPGLAIPEPYAQLHGGSFSGPPLHFCEDPLGSYQWEASVNASELQIFDALPASVEATAGSAPGAFVGLESLLTATPSVRVTGAGAIQLFYAAELAAWLEFDSPDLSAIDAAHVTMSLSESSAPWVCNLGEKTARPVAYAGGVNGTTTYRLELPHPGLYEGVRYAWLSVNATPAASWTITGFRAVAQVKPTNWGGAFAAAGDDMLSRIWYIGAYTTKVNLLSDQFGSILMYRGDRFSWTGDAHVAQATAMAALGDFPFVFANIFYTRDNCNGIESYCLYLALSVTDYYAATGDAAGLATMAPFIVPKLEHAAALVLNSSARANLGFVSWDDRGGSGFENSTCDEAQALYGFLAQRVWLAWAAAMNATANATAAAHFAAADDAAQAASATRGAAAINAARTPIESERRMPVCRCGCERGVVRAFCCGLRAGEKKKRKKSEFEPGSSGLP